MGYKFQVGQKVICSNAAMANRNEGEDPNWRPPITLEQGNVYEIIDIEWYEGDLWLSFTVVPDLFYLARYFSPLPLDYEWVEQVLASIRSTDKK